MRLVIGCLSELQRIRLTLAQLLVLPNGVLQVLPQAQTLLPISLILDQHLINLGHLDAALDLFNLNIAFIQLTALFSNRALVAVD